MLIEVGGDLRSQPHTPGGESLERQRRGKEAVKKIRPSPSAEKLESCIGDRQVPRRVRREKED